MARVQVTVDSELERALAELGHGGPRSRAIRELALRGADALRAERRRRAEALETLDRIAAGEDEGFDFAVSAALDAEPYGSGGLVVFDTSAWNRQRAQADVSARWRATLAAAALTVCPVVALELLASARDEEAFGRLDAALAALPQAPVTRAGCAAALAASRELRGERRLPAADYLIVAAAAECGAAVLHYDRHFDPLCRALGVDGIWLAEPGRLD